MADSLRLSCSSLEQLPEIAKQLLDYSGTNTIFLLDAPMGAGKTTLIKAMCKLLGSNDHFSSPTFSIVNEYVGANKKIFHFDLYRINNLGELFDIGIDEYLASGQYCFIEWPEKMRDIIDPPYVRIRIEPNENIRYFYATKF